MTMYSNIWFTPTTCFQIDYDHQNTELCMSAKSVEHRNNTDRLRKELWTPYKNIPSMWSLCNTFKKECAISELKRTDNEVM